MKKRCGKTQTISMIRQSEDLPDTVMHPPGEMVNPRADTIVGSGKLSGT